MPVTATDDPRKQSEDMHKTVVDVAKAVSDSFYKVDAALLGLPPNNAIGEELKAIRDNIFVQKQRAEKLVAGASEQLAQLPPPAPEPPETPDALKPAPQPQAAPAAPVQAAKKAGVPSKQAETMVDCLKKGQAGEEGSLATDGQTVTLAGVPIFKVEGEKISATWTDKPSMTVAANVNSLAAIYGIERPFTMQGESPMVSGKVLADPKAWVELRGAVSKPVAASRRASTPSLLLPRPN